MIIIDGLRKHYGDFSLDVSLTLPAGRVSGLVGKNGAGKSTTIKAILGLIRAEAGSVKVLGKEACELSEKDKEELGVALSDSFFSPYLSAKAIQRILKNGYGSFEETKFERLCAEMDLPMNKPLKEFSTGMRAKLKVISAISHKARLLILDEPTAGLDVEARNSVLELLRDYLADNEDSSLLISSHISSDLESLCDDIYLIHEGKIILHENTDELLDRYGVLKVDEKTYEELDKSHVLAVRKERFGYSLFTAEKQYYLDNYPSIVIEKGNIDDLILIMTGGTLL